MLLWLWHLRKAFPHQENNLTIYSTWQFQHKESDYVICCCVWLFKSEDSRSTLKYIYSSTPFFGGNFLQHNTKLHTKDVSFLKTSCDIGQKHASAIYSTKKGFWWQYELNMSKWNCGTCESHFHCPSEAEYALYSNTCDLFTSAHLTEGDQPHSVWFFFFLKNSSQ